MKTLTVRLPEVIAAEIESESRAEGISKSDVVRRRLERAGQQRPGGNGGMTFFDLTHDLIGSGGDDAMPADVSARRKHYLRKWGYGKGRHR